MLTLTDGYAGAGGSSSGAEQVPGVQVRTALNHWPLAIATHNENMPHVDHDRVDITDRQFDPARYPATDLGWFSPECTYWSQARGDACDYDTVQAELPGIDEDDEPVSDEAKWRSRFGMETVPLFVRAHRYRALVVENVPDIMKWSGLDKWIRTICVEGYRHATVVLNSAVAQQLGAPAPQLRDRVYFAFWQERYPDPDFDRWTRPDAWCPVCETTVRAVYAPKPGPRRPMRYGKQYVYRCPSVRCRNAEVAPYVLPAAAAIDWSLPAERIGDRRQPLRPKTMARIAAGLARYAMPSLVPAGGTRRRDAAGVSMPMATRTTRENDGLCVPPLLVPVEGRAEAGSARTVDAPGRAQTARLQDALVVPLRNNTTARLAATGLLPAFAAAGQHHALVMRNVNSRGGQMCTPLDEPVRTITASCRQSLVSWSHLYSYDTGGMRPLGHPLPAQTTVQGDAVLGAAPAVEDCTFRMLDVHEIKAGMAFEPVFRMSVGAKRDKVRMLGNAVTPPAARDLVACLVEAVTGTEVPR